MLNTIYDILGIIIGTITIISLLMEVDLKINNKNNSVINTTIRIVLRSNIFTLFIIRIILAIILEELIVINIIFAILWGLCSISGFLSLKTPDSNDNKDI